MKHDKRPMRQVILVGVGGMGTCWTRCVAQSKRWNAAAYVDINKTHLMAAASRHGLPRSRCYVDLDKALREVEADVLIDVTPPQSRKKVCSAAFRAGLDVLAEKPLADTIRNAKTIVRLAAKLDRTFLIAQNYRYQACVQTVKRFLEKGRLGEVGYVGITFHRGPRFGGFRETMAYPLVYDMAIHHFDLLRAVTGADIRSVQARSINAPWNWNAGDATVMAQLDLTNKIVANYFASWVALGRETDWNGEWRIEGSKGTLLWRSDDILFSDRPRGGRKVRPVRWPQSHQAYLLDAFADALDTGNEPETSGADNLNSFAATHAVVRAAKQGQRVAVGELLR